jgi:hypothetical protein
MAHHKDLTGVDLHEPKGVATATSGQVYVADGAGSGAWTTKPGAKVAICRVILDVSTAGDVYLPAPCAGSISFISAILEAAISGADANVTFKINGVSIDTSALVIAQSGSAAGDEFDSTPTGHNTVVAGDVIKITTDGASTGTAVLSVVLLIDVS